MFSDVCCVRNSTRRSEECGWVELRWRGVFPLSHFCDIPRHSPFHSFIYHPVRDDSGIEISRLSLCILRIRTYASASSSWTSQRWPGLTQIQTCPLTLSPPRNVFTLLPFVFPSNNDPAIPSPWQLSLPPWASHLQSVKTHFPSVVSASVMEALTDTVQ